MKDPVHLLPSEIARLVYGQLIQMNCHNVADKFLKSSPQLKECRTQLEKGSAFWTRVFGLSLEEILDRYLDINETISEQINKDLLNSDTQYRDSTTGLNHLLECGSCVPDKNGQSNDSPEFNESVRTEEITDEMDFNTAALTNNVNSLNENQINITIDFRASPAHCNHAESNRHPRRIHRKPARYSDFLIPKKYQNDLSNTRSLENVESPSKKLKIKTSKLENSPAKKKNTGLGQRVESMKEIINEPDKRLNSNDKATNK